MRRRPRLVRCSLATRRTDRARTKKRRRRLFTGKPDGRLELAHDRGEIFGTECGHREVADVGRDPDGLRLVALMTEPKEIRRYLRALGEPTEPPARGPARGPPFWASRALRRRAGDVDAA
jgi:hypothetical protein